MSRHAAALVLLASVAMRSLACEDKAQPTHTSDGATSARAAGSNAGPIASASATPDAPRRFDAELRQYAYPFPVKTFDVPFRGGTLAMRYMDERPATPNGKTVVLLHGKNFVAASWAETMRALLERGYRVVAPDQLGFGKSAKPADYPFSFHALAKNTRELLASQGIEKSVVVGHSMGGMLAARYALSYPDATTELVLVNPIGLEDWKTVVPYRSVDDWYKTELAQTPASLRDYQTKSYYDGKWLPAYEPNLEPQAGFTTDPDYPKVAWCSALTYDMIFTQPVVYELPRIKARTLLVIGQRDRTALGKAWAAPEVGEKLGDYPALGRATQRAIPASTLVELEGVGHLPQVEAFQRFRDELIKFLGP